MNNRSMNGLYAQAPAYSGGGMVPASNFGSSGPGNGLLNFMGGGIGGMLSGLFGNSGKPYDDAMDQYQKYGQQATDAQQPYAQAGQGAIGDYQKWLQSQQDPSGFMNNLMGQYQESPFAKYQQQQGMRAGQNMGSASGLSGSSAMQQQMQQNSQNISSQDMQNWLGNALGINTQYGQGQQSLMQGGQNAANQMSNIYSNMGQNMGDAAYGKRAGQNQDWSNMIGGGISLASMFL